MRSLGTLCVELYRGFKMAGILSVFLDVQMRTDLLIEFFGNNFTGTDSDSTSHQVDDSGASILASSQLKHADGDIECGTNATCRSVSLLCWPRIWLKIIKDRVKSEFTLADGHEEFAKCVRVTLVERVARLTQAKLTLDLCWSENLVSLENIRLGAVLEAELMHECHLTVSYQADKSVFWDKVD